MALILSSLALWELAAWAGWVATIFFPAPSQVLLTLVCIGGSTEFWVALGITLFRLAAGVLVGGGSGLLLGWVMGASPGVRAAADPILSALHPLPKLAIFPIFLVLLGIGEPSKIALLATVAFFPMAINTLAGVQQIDKAYWATAINYGADGVALVRRVIVPGSLPMVLVGLRLTVNSVLVVTIAVEMLAAQKGLGARIWLVWQTLRLEELYAVLLVIAGLGLAINGILNLTARSLLPWQVHAKGVNHEQEKR